MHKKIFLTTFVVTMFLHFGFVTAEEINFKGKSPETIYCQKISNNECRLMNNNLIVVMEKDYPDINIDYIELLFEGGREITYYFNDCESYFTKEVCIFELGSIIHSNNAKEIDLKLKVSGVFKIGNKSRQFTDDIGVLNIIIQECSDVVSLNNFIDNMEKMMASIGTNAKNTLFTIGTCVRGDEKIEFKDNFEFYRKETESLGFEKVLPQPHENDVLITDLVDYLSVFIGITPLYEVNKILKPYFYNGMNMTHLIWFGDSPGQKIMRNSVYHYCRLSDSLIRNFDSIFNAVLIYSQEKKLSEKFGNNVFDSGTEIRKTGDYSSRMLGDIGEPARSSIKINVNGYPLRDNGRMCANGIVRIDFENIGKFGINKTEVIGSGKNASNNYACDVTHHLYYENGKGSWYGTTEDFICHPENEPIDGMKYYVIISIPSRSDMMYTLTYHDDPSMCTIKQENIIVE